MTDDRPVRFQHSLRVRYCETDQMGVAHHGSFVAWFEEARTARLEDGTEVALKVTGRSRS